MDQIHHLLESPLAGPGLFIGIVRFTSLHEFILPTERPLRVDMEPFVPSLLLCWGSGSFQNERLISGTSIGMDQKSHDLGSGGKRIKRYKEQSGYKSKLIWSSALGRLFLQLDDNTWWLVAAVSGCIMPVLLLIRVGRKSASKQVNSGW